MIRPGPGLDCYQVTKCMERRHRSRLTVPRFFYILDLKVNCSRGQTTDRWGYGVWYKARSQMTLPILRCSGPFCVAKIHGTEQILLAERLITELIFFSHCTHQWRDSRERYGAVWGESIHHRDTMQEVLSAGLQWCMKLRVTQILFDIESSNISGI